MDETKVLREEPFEALQRVKYQKIMFWYQKIIELLIWPSKGIPIEWVPAVNSSERRN